MSDVHVREVCVVPGQRSRAPVSEPSGSNPGMACPRDPRASPIIQGPKKAQIHREWSGKEERCPKGDDRQGHVPTVGARPK